jgi:hypothetical protein
MRRRPLVTLSNVSFLRLTAMVAVSSSLSTVAFSMSVIVRLDRYILIVGCYLWRLAPTLRQSIAEAGGIPLILTSIRIHIDDEYVLRNALGALATLAQSDWLIQTAITTAAKGGMNPSKPRRLNDMSSDTGSSTLTTQ